MTTSVSGGRLRWLLYSAAVQQRLRWPFASQTITSGENQGKRPSVATVYRILAEDIGKRHLMKPLTMPSHMRKTGGHFRHAILREFL
ncbi:hypothetical protein DIZ27_33410 [Streptomyces sp. NWU339]|uniref:hypothetical protein n=1 Tax=Streptomyces sp. NWU339 TaxID=2185284 RepID=UPI000D67EBB7|nr:hypothetical protein [Streptomyces sp. NWU339]PWI06396.1 hypothetical protein DIZ27_33410 [Streptomyces sp. NWU339]